MADRAPRTRKPVRVRVHRTNLNDGYLITPNDLFRGEGVYKGLSEHARLLLGAGLSCKDSWDTSLADIEAWLPSLGRDRQEAVRRELRERGFLSMEPNRDGQEFHWTYAFHMEPLDVDDRDELQPKTGKRSRKTAGQPEPGKAGHRDAGVADESAGQPEPGFSGPRGSGHRTSGHHARSLPEKNHLEEEPPPPTPQTTGAGAAAVDAVEVEDSDNGEAMKTARELFAALVDAVSPARHPRGRQRLQVLTGLVDALTSGWDRHDLYAALNGELNTAGSVGAVMLHRIGDLGTPPRRASTPSQRAPRQECTRTDCDGHGYLTAGTGTIACPTCRPSVHATQLARAGVADLDALLAKVNT